MKWGTQFYFSQNEELEKCIQIFPIIKSMLIIIFDIFSFLPLFSKLLPHPCSTNLKRERERERGERGCRDCVDFRSLIISSNYFFSFSQWNNKFERKLFFSYFWVFLNTFSFLSFFPSQRWTKLFLFFIFVFLSCFIFERGKRDGIRKNRG